MAKTCKNPKGSAVSDPGFSMHDHTACIHNGVALAAAKCTESGLQFTPVRRRVLEILLNEHRAMGAYDVLEKLRLEGLGSQPPIAYRALDFLVKNGFAHKVERLNAFVACAQSGTNHMPAFLICGACDSVAETAWALDHSQFADAAGQLGFSVDTVTIEAVGTCPNCQESAAK